MNRTLLVLACCLSALSQEFRATLSGRITDPSGASVAGAKVDARALATGNTQSTVSNADGIYVLPNLNPGEYSLTVEKTGFRKVVRDGLRLSLAERGVADVSLTLGEVTQTVNVTEQTQILETESADRSLVIERERIANTPLQGRNIFAQAWSAPGVAVTASAQRLRPFDIAGSSAMSISGGRPSGNEVLIDGVSNLARAGQVAFVPPVEGTGEFRVQTSSYDAQYGWTTGGVVNITTKSGTNQFHGSAFEFLQNTVLNANTFNSNRNGIARQSSNINTYGGDFGGPVIKNKFFAHYAYEKIDQIIPDPFVTSVATDAQRRGDFSQTFFAAGQMVQVYDPFSTRSVNGAFVRDAFPNNTIPASRQNQIARNVLGIIPSGNVPGNAVTGLNNLVSTPSTRKFTDFFPEHSVRGDYIFNDSSRMFIRYSRNALAEERGFRYSTVSTLNVAETSGNTPFKRENHSATIQYTKTLTPNFIADVRLGLARFLAQSGNSIGQGYDIRNLGFSQAFTSLVPAYFPRFNLAGFEAAGSNPVQNDPISQTNSGQVSFARNAGKQYQKFGFEYRLQRAYIRNPGFVAGFYDFNTLFTARNAAQGAEPSSGHAIASFLLGTAANGGVDINAQAARQQKLFSFYFQDDIRVTRNLKLNFGLRWDYLGPMTDRFNGLLRGFDRTTTSPLQAPPLQLKGGPLYAGVGGERGIFKQDWNNFGPRVAMAYSLNDKTVLRAGYGLIYAQTFNDPGNAPGFSQRTPMVTSIRTGVPENTLTNPFPTGLLQPVGASQGLSTFLGQGFNAPFFERSLPMTHQYSFEIQRELPGNFLASIGYAGSAIRGLEVNRAINEISLTDFNRGAAALTANVPNPMAGKIPGTGLNGATVQAQQLLRPFPQFTGITELFRSEGRQRYDGLQSMIYKRLSDGLNFSVAYTWSRTFEWRQYRNPQDDFLDKLPVEWDMPHNLQLNGLYDLPFGKGKKFFSDAPGIVDRVFGGWQVSAIARIQSGWPLLLNTNSVPTGRDPKVANPTLDRYFNTCTQLANGTLRGCSSGEQPVWTVRQAFTQQTFAARITSIRRPPIRNLDVSVLKYNKITERVGLTFRTDFLNATNTPQFFNGPITDVNNGNFGRISGAMDQSNLPRFIQLSLKLQF